MQVSLTVFLMSLLVRIVMNDSEMEIQSSCEDALNTGLLTVAGAQARILDVSHL